MKRLAFSLVLAAAACGNSTTTLVPAAFSADWLITEDGVASTCANVGADTVTFDWVDTAGAKTTFIYTCEQGNGQAVTSTATLFDITYPTVTVTLWANYDTPATRQSLGTVTFTNFDAP